MARIAAHHQLGSGHPLPTDTQYRPCLAWPEDAGCQWGSGRSFVPLGGEDTGGPAFFEAFLADARGIHFRGEAESGRLLDAEKAAFAKYQRFVACGQRPEGHDWQRKFDEYSSVGHCPCCKTVATKVFTAKEIPEPTDGPLMPRDLCSIADGWLKPRAVITLLPNLGEDWDRGIQRWRAAMAVKLPALAANGYPVLTPPDADAYALTEDSCEAYLASCKQVVTAHWHAHRAWYEAHAATLGEPIHEALRFWAIRHTAELDFDVKQEVRRNLLPLPPQTTSPSDDPDTLPTP